MALSCSYIPQNKKGEELKGFQVYKKNLGYQTAAKVFTQVLSPSFQEKYKKTLEMDGQGVPTYESAVRVSHIKNLIGSAKLIEADQKKYSYVDNTRENYRMLLQNAYAYNNSSENRDNTVAVVTPSPDGSQLRVEIRENNEKNLNEFRNQYSTSLLNYKIIDILGDLGVTLEMLEGNEITNGVVDFSKASSIADGFAGLIKIANGMEGELALSEEFSHLLIGMFRNTPLIQRSLNLLAWNEDLMREILGDEFESNMEYYSENPNYDEFGEEIPIEYTLAEEALGRVLQEKLKTSDASTKEEKPSSPLQNLVSRLLSYIKRVFKGMKDDDIVKAKNEVNTTMGELAKDVLTGTKKLSKEEIVNNQRNAQFNHLKDDVDKVLQTLRNADEIERKRSKIVPKDTADEVKKRITHLETLITDAKKLEGLHTYAKWALKDLQDSMNSLSISGSLESGDFTSLRHTKSVLDSYAGFINDFSEALDDMGDDVVITVGEEQVNLKELWKEIDKLYKTCTTLFQKQALAAFSDFLAPIYDRSPLRNADGSIKDLKDVLTEEDFDISEFDRWLTSMGNSSSPILAMFDKAVKNAKDKVRFKTIDNIRSIWKIRENAEKRGITTFEWMYEKDREGHKTGNYISEYNYSQYRKDLEEMNKAIIEKYGRHPTGEEYKKAWAEKQAWYDSHATTDIFGSYMPNESYRNQDYARLSKAQLDTLNEILDYKDSLETMLPSDRRNRFRAIQRRRSGVQRMSDLFSDASNAYESIKDDIVSSFRRTEDDDQLYGETTKGLTDFTGKEYMTLPILYTGRLKNPDTLSTDIFSDLMAYAYMANTYKEMSQIYDPLEVGVSVVSNKEFVKGKQGKTKEEVLNVLGRVSRKSVKAGTNTSFEKKLRDFLECQMYGRYMKDDDILGENTQKTLGLFQRLTSMAYLGCNYLAGVANVATAVGMQNIEAAANEFFGAKELLKADGEYMRMLPEFMAELAERNKQSELALFDELFDIKQNIKDRVHNGQHKSLLKRIFGVNWLFIQQGAGDHWIYNRTGIAMAKKKMVSVNGRKMSVWDAREIVTDKNGYKKMVIKKGAKELDDNGNIIGDFDAGRFSREIAHVNHTIAGIYNDEDQNAANRIIVGRMVLQMRKWIIPQMMRRFQSKRMNFDTGKMEEGFHRTAMRFAIDMWKAGFKITEEWDKLTPEEKANIRRAITEYTQTFSLWVICTALEYTGKGIKKDPDRLWALKFAEYMAHRELHELGFLTPSPLMLTEGYKTVTSPVVCLSAANKLAQAIVTTANPFNWFPEDDELIQSGRYEGHSHIYKRWMELPLPPMTQIRQIEKFVDDLDTGTKYYSRDYR